MKQTTDLKLKFLGIVPQGISGKENLSPQLIAAFSGLLTFKGRSLESLIKEAKAKRQNIKEKVKLILRKSALRGHASMATMPVFCFAFEGSKMIGSMLTGITFSSALMHSGRRAQISVKDNIFPESIAKNKRIQAVYKQAAKLNIDTFNKLLELGVPQDEASKIIHYGTYGTGIITLPVESLVTFLQEYEIEKEWMPEEAGLLIRKIEKNLKKMGVDLVYATRSVAPRNTYPYPNLFKNPKKSNLARDLRTDDRETKIVELNSSLLGTNFKKRVLEIIKKQKEIFKNFKRHKKEWPELLSLRRKLIRDYNNGLNIKILSKVSWRVWRDKKRHRTAPVATESIYYCLKEAIRVFDKYKKTFHRRGDLTEDQISDIDKVFAVPQNIARKSNVRKIFLKAAFMSFETYQKMLKLGIKERDAVFIIPRSLRITMLQEYNIHNVIDGYYPLRSCTTAEEQLLRLTKEEIRQISKALKKRGLGMLSKLIEPKCCIAGFCPEEESCGYLKKHIPEYNDDFNQKMKTDLEKRYQKKLTSLGK